VADTHVKKRNLKGRMNMKKEDLIKLGLDEEMAQKVAEASAEELKGFIPKQRFDEVNAAKKQLEQELKDRDAQLEELKKVDAAGLQQKIQELQEANKKAAEEYQAKLNQQAFDFALKEALTGAKAKNVKAVEALLNKEAIKLDGDKLLGLEEQLKALKESDAYLFEDEQQQQQQQQHTTKFTTGNHQRQSPSNEPTTLAEALAAKFFQQ
jgi:vancomycin resistance protein YoaR